jgi:hypothetical protein
VPHVSDDLKNSFFISLFFPFFFFLDSSYQRANGREKEVDHAIAVDMVEQASRIVYSAPHDEAAREELASTTIVVVSGDRDLHPAIVKVLGLGIPVHMMAYTGSISSQFFRLEKQQQQQQQQQQQRAKFTITRLEQHLEDISFFNFFSTRPAVDLDRAVVIDLAALGIRADQTGVQDCCRRLQATRLLFYVSRPGGGASSAGSATAEVPTATTNTLCIEFPTVTAVEALEACRTVLSDNPDACRLMRSQQHSQQATQPQRHTWIGAAAATGSSSPRASTLSVSAPVFVSSSPAPSSAAVSAAAAAAAASGNLTGVRRTGTKMCPYGMHCDRNLDCTQGHTPEQLRLFSKYREANKNMNFRQWKSALCTHPDAHPAAECSFSHGPGDEQWCPRCRAPDHLLVNCPARKQQQ